MNISKQFARLFGLALIALLAVGCLVSGTFIIVDEFNFTTHSSTLYFYRVDFTDEQDWIDHKDDIDQIDAVGLDFWISNTASNDVVFKVYVDDASNTDTTNVPSTASVIIDSIIVKAGEQDRHVTYVESLGFIKNLARLKALAKTGELEYFGENSTATGGVFTIDSGKVVVTVSASGS